jgi:hypothetical protein
MGGIQSRNRPLPATYESTDYLSKTVPAVAHREQFPGIARTGFPPATGQRLRGRSRGERSLKLIGNKKNVERGPIQEVFLR